MTQISAMSNWLGSASGLLLNQLSDDVRNAYMTLRWSLPFGPTKSSGKQGHIFLQRATLFCIQHVFEARTHNWTPSYLKNVQLSFMHGKLWAGRYSKSVWIMNCLLIKGKASLGTWGFVFFAVGALSLSWHHFSAFWPPLFLFSLHSLKLSNWAWRIIQIM